MTQILPQFISYNQNLLLRNLLNEFSKMQCGECSASCVITRDGDSQPGGRSAELWSSGTTRRRRRARLFPATHARTHAREPSRTHSLTQWTELFDVGCLFCVLDCI